MIVTPDHPAQKARTNMTLPKSQIEILHALKDGKLYSYREIVLATGKYSNLSGELRERHPRSLGCKGMVREVWVKIGDDNIAAFMLTESGALEIGAKPSVIQEIDEAREDFTKRYSHWREQYGREKAEAEKVGLRRNQYCFLKAMEDGSEKTMADLARDTGIFSNMPQDLRARYGNNSLASLGLCKETIIEKDDGTSGFTHAFRITAKGSRTLDKAKQIG